MHLEPISLSILGVVLGTVAHAIVGAAWYSPALFVNRWLAAIGKTEDQMDGSPALSIGSSVVGSVVTTAIIGIIYA